MNRLRAYMLVLVVLLVIVICTTWYQMAKPQATKPACKPKSTQLCVPELNPFP